MIFKAADMELHTPRLNLRPISVSDAPALFAARSDPDVMRFWDWPVQKSVAEVEDVFRLYAPAPRDESMLWWAVALSPHGPAIGECDLNTIDHQHRRAEVGYLFARAHWSKGYAAEATQAVIATAFGALKLERLTARVHSGNEKSVRLLERLGFRYEGTLRAYFLRDGERRDCLLYGLTKS